MEVRCKAFQVERSESCESCFKLGTVLHEPSECHGALLVPLAPWCECQGFRCGTSAFLVQTRCNFEWKHPRNHPLVRKRTFLVGFQGVVAVQEPRMFLRRS